MKRIEFLYRLAMWIYPRSFRDRFAHEMTSVFLEGLNDAEMENRAAIFLLRELLQMPVSVIDAYFWAFSRQANLQLAVSATGGSKHSLSSDGHQNSWKAAFMAGLPHLIVGMLTGGVMLLNALSPELGKLFNSQSSLWLFFILGAALIGIVIYSLRRGWQNWSASWLLYFAFLPLALLLSGIQLLPWEKSYPWLQVVVWTVLPLVMSYLLYRITCTGQLRGLLAALPMSLFIWIFFQEFVPDILRGSASIWMWGLAFTSAALTLRRGQLVFGILLVLGVIICSGLPFVYLSVYHGGTLPSNEPVPTIAEVIRQFLPFFEIACAILLGPQLAVQLRDLGKATAAGGGTIAVRLALGGLLLALANELADWAMTANDALFVGKPYTLIHQWILWIGGILYLVGLGLLLRAVIINLSASEQDWAPIKFSLLAIALPCVPFTLYLFNYQFKSGENLLLEIAHWILLGWIVAAAWVASRKLIFYGK